MSNGTRFVLGFDIGDRLSTAALLDVETGELRPLQTVATTPSDVGALLKGLPPGTRVVLETGTHARWISDLAKRAGHEAVVADARRLEAVTKNARKSDREDASLLARLGASSVELLCPVTMRDGQLQADLSVLRMRAALVEARTALINACRGTAKSLGLRLPSCGADVFARKAAAVLDETTASALGPAFLAIAELTSRIADYDSDIERLCAKHPAAARLRDQVPGVGAQTALCFVLTIGDPSRFGKTRDVAAYAGLVPRRSQSGGSDPQLGISKTGDAMLRRLLVQCAHQILGHFGKECDLRTWGLALAERGGANAKKRAVVATARKLAVLLLALWKSGKEYEPVRRRAA
jgi:transposase